METGTIVLIVVIALLLVLLVAGLLVMQRRRRTAELQGSFGPEYDRAVDRHGDRRTAEHDLAERRDLRERLEVTELAPERREHFAQSWRQIQMRFVDEPNQAVDEAHTLVRQVMGERGYPADDMHDRDATVSVDHPELAEDYRSANRISDASKQGRATTEELREAMVHYRGLFARLLEGGDTSVRG